MAAYEIVLHPDDRIWFEEERIGYTVQAVSSDGRWAACTKPMALHKTVLYTVVDLVDELRGTDNFVGCLGYETRDDCREAIAMFELGDAEFSRRTGPIALNIRRVKRAEGDRDVAV